MATSIPATSKKMSGTDTDLWSGRTAADIADCGSTGNVTASAFQISRSLLTMKHLRTLKTTRAPGDLTKWKDLELRKKLTNKKTYR